MSYYNSYKYQRHATASRHQNTPKDNENEIDGLLIYFIFSLLVVAFILCLLYARLAFRCPFPHTFIKEM